MSLIRAAVPADAPAIVGILNPIIAQTTITFAPDPVRPEDVCDGIRAHAARGDPYLVYDVGTVAGFAKYGPFRAGAGYADTVEITLHLAPHMRGAGAGRILMDAMERHAVRSGKRSLIAGISGENDHAIGFHAHMGYAQVGHIPQAGFKFGRAIDLILMQKFL